MSLAAIVGRVREIGCPLVQITGGEPLAHPNGYVLARQLVDAGFTVLVETSGSEYVAPLPGDVHVIMDLKCPGSGESSRNLLENLDELDGRDEVKFVIADREDYEWSRQMVRAHGLDRRVEEGTLRAVLFSPVWGESGPGLEALAAWVLADGLPVRLQTQLHKHIWDPARRGV